MIYDKIVAPTVTELFVSRIQSSIISGELKIGEKLPTERDLAEKMGISKSAVHIGLKDLERAGFIDIIPRQGIYVSNWPENGGLETLTALLKSNVLKLDANNLHSLIMIREAIEGDAILVLAANHTQQNIHDLNDIAENIRSGGHKTPAEGVEQLADYAFHFTHYICFHSGNVFSSLIMNTFKSFAIRLWIEWIRQIGPDAAADYLVSVSESIKRGDGQNAIRIIHNYNLDFLKSIETN